MLSCFSHVQLCATLWTVAHQAPVSRGFSKQENWIGLPFPSPEDLPDPGIKPTSFRSPALAGRFFTTTVAWESRLNCLTIWHISFRLLFWVANCNLLECKDGMLLGGGVVSNTAWYVGSYFLGQGLNPCPLQWEHRALTTGSPGNSQWQYTLPLFVEFWRLEVQHNVTGLTSRCWQMVFFLEIQGVNPLPLLIQAPETLTLLGAQPPASTNPAMDGGVSHADSPASLCDLRGHRWWRWTHLDDPKDSYHLKTLNFIITPAKSFIPSNVTSTGSRGWKVDVGEDQDLPECYPHPPLIWPSSSFTLLLVQRQEHELPGEIHRLCH